MRYRYGFPVLALEYSETNRVQADVWKCPAGAWRTLGSINEYPMVWPPPDLPIRPLWGFAANAVLYGGVFYLVGIAFVRGLRWFRRGRGQCAACSYSLAGLPANAVCPECGGAQ